MCCVSFWCDSLTNNVMSTQYLDSLWLLLSKRKKKEYQTIQDSKLCVHSFLFISMNYCCMSRLSNNSHNELHICISLSKHVKTMNYSGGLPQNVKKKSWNTIIKVLVMRFEKESLKYKENRIYKAVSMFYFYLHYEQWRFEFIDDSHQMVQNMMET